MTPNQLCYPPAGVNALAIFGAGAAGREVSWLAQECWGDGVALTYLVDMPDVSPSECNGIPVTHIEEFARRSPETPVVIAIGDPVARELIVRRCIGVGLGFATLVHPRVEASRWITIGKGTIICAGAILTTNIVIGEHVYVNVGCTISHDPKIADFATLSPGVHIAGWVTVGRGVLFGAGAVVKNGSSDRPLVIGDNAIIGAGACVVRDVEANSTVVGVPARVRA